MSENTDIPKAKPETATTSDISRINAEIRALTPNYLGDFTPKALSGLTYSQLREAYGLETHISRDGQSERARFMTRYAKSSDNPLSAYGKIFEGNSQVEDTARSLYNTALHNFLDLVTRTNQNGELQFQPTYVGGSTLRSNIRLGIYPIGITYEEAKEHQLSPERTQKRIYPSDIDIYFDPIKDSQRTDPIHLLSQKASLDQIAKLIFEEYGVFIHFSLEKTKPETVIAIEEVKQKDGLFT